MVFLTLAIGVMLAGVTWSAKASTTGSGSYTVNAAVPEPRPGKPAIITSPSTGQTFNANPIEVLGTCPAKSLVKIFKNDILAGSTICDASGHFKLMIDLVIGRNDLTALAFNTLDQQGPTSPTVTVTLNQPPGGYGFSTELIIQSETYYRGTTPGREIVWPIELVGGQAPYAVIVDWGDGTSDLITRLAPGPFTVKHTYKKVGTGFMNTFPLIIRATDAVGHTAYLQLTTIVNDPTGTNTSGNATPAATNVLVMWPLWIVLVVMIVSFWLGERREKRIMERRLAALS